MVKDINELEPQMQRLTDDDLKGKTADFRQRLKQGATLDDLLIEAFAVVREVSSRVLRLRHYDAQLVSLYMPFYKDAQAFCFCGCCLSTSSALLPLIRYTTV